MRSRQSGNCAHSAFCTLALLGVATLSEPCVAVQARVSATSAGQYYTAQSPWGEPILRRRRFTQTLGLGLRDLDGYPSSESFDLEFDARLRLDADFGQVPEQRDPQRPDYYVPGLEQAPLDVMHAYLQARGLLDDTTSLRLGRQYVVDSLGWWSFDGAWIHMTSPVHLAVEAYGGYEQRGGLPWMSTSRFEADGVYRGSRDGLDMDQWPGFLEESRAAPAWGAALQTVGLQGAQARLSYRRVIERDRVVVGAVEDAGGRSVYAQDRVSSERFGVAARIDEPGLGGLATQAVYDAYLGILSYLYATVEWDLRKTLVLAVDGSSYRPTFDADSIFNFFVQNPTQQAVLRADWQALRSVQISGTAGLRMFSTVGDPVEYGAEPMQGLAVNDDVRDYRFDQIASITTRTRSGEGTAELNSFAEVGDSGDFWGSRLFTTHTFGEGFYDVMATLSVTAWRNALRPERDAVSATYVIGGGVTPSRRTHAGLEWEHTMNRLSGQRFRVVATLELEAQ